MNTATVISFASAATQHAVLLQLKLILKDSHCHIEQAAHQFIEDLEEMYATGTLTLAEFALLSGKAADVLGYFHFTEVRQLRKTDSCVREGIVLQISIALLQALRQLRPDLSDNALLSDTAYNFYSYQWRQRIPFSPRPLKTKNWVITTV